MPETKLLVHICCAHCAAYTITHWRAEGYDVTGLWYNPNIHPFAEHNSRLEAVRKLSSVQQFPLVVIDGYDIEKFFYQTNTTQEARCAHCFELRLKKTAQTALEKGITLFTSSLLISPLQQHQRIISAGQQASVCNQSSFLYHDLRKHYSDSRRMTKPLNLYTQKYCGCLHSEFASHTNKQKERINDDTH